MENNRKAAAFAALFLFFGTLGAAGWAIYRRLPERETRPAGEEVRFPIAGDADLLERSGKPMTLADLEGKTWIAGFFFTRCPGPCIQLSARMAKLQADLAGAGVWLASFSVDPEYDRPEVLLRYADNLSAGDRWLFLTGKREALWRLIREGFRLGVQEAPPGSPDGPITHSSRLVLVDGTRTIRGYYESADPEALARLARDARRLVSASPRRVRD